MKITLNELRVIIRKIITEQNSKTTFQDNLIIDNNGKRVFVGIDHGIKPILNKNEIKIIKQVGDRYGYWYEGAGGDKEVIKSLFSEIDFQGSWDNKISNIKSQNLYTYIYTLFANTKENNTLYKINNSHGKTVFEKILNSVKLWAHEKIKYYILSNKKQEHKSKKQIAKLIKKFIKELGINFYDLSKFPATEENVNNFILSIEKEMWDNWPDGETKAARLAFIANSERDQQLIDTIKQGVIFIGKGHIVLLDRLLR